MRIALIVLLCLLSGVPAAYSEDDALAGIGSGRRTQKEKKPEYTFSVSGFGRVFYTVDCADIEFSISVRDEDVQTCKTKHDKIIEGLNAYLEKQKYAKEVLSLKNSKLQRHERRNSRESDYYLAKSTYFLRTTRLKDLSTLQADIVQLGVDEIIDVHLFSTRQRELEDKARLLALEDAKKQAELTAKALGWILGKPVRVSWGSNYNNDGGRFGMRGGRGVSRADVTASANTVDINVTVTYRYEIQEE